MAIRNLLWHRDVGLLVLRVGLGLMMAAAHGFGKITAGPDGWTELGNAVGALGIPVFLPVFWGFMAAVAEFVGALLVTVGFVTRPAALLLVLNMSVAATAHISGAIDGGPELALVYGIVFLSLLFVGPGAYSIDEQLGG